MRLLSAGSLVRKHGCTIGIAPAVLLQVFSADIRRCTLIVGQQFHSMDTPGAVQALQEDTQSSGEEFLSRLTNFERSGVPAMAGTVASDCFDLGRMRRLMLALGNPQDAWPAVHIAGSKGKGSTATFVASILRCAGYKVGLYTSPHLQHISERISTLSGYSGIEPAGYQKLVAVHQAVLQKVQEEEGGKLSHFEATTALAFKHFADEGVDITVIETGLGGTTDATNVLSAARLQCAVITSLGMEHVEALGGSLESIAIAKAGIMKTGRPVIVSSQQHPETLDVLQAHAQQMGCSITAACDQVTVTSHGWMLEPTSRTHAARERLHIEVHPPPKQGIEGSADSGGVVHCTQLQMQLSVALGGLHQHSNVATAVATALKLRQAGWKIDDAHLVAGLEVAWLRGRFQVVHQPDGRPAPYIILDGAHTEASAVALTVTTRSLFPTAPVILVLAMAADKEHKAVLGALRGLSPKVVIFTSVPVAGDMQRAAAPGTLAAHWQAAGMTPGATRLRARELIQANLRAALEKAHIELRAFPEPGVVVVTGSSYAVAAAYEVDSLSLEEH